MNQNFVIKHKTKVEAYSITITKNIVFFFLNFKKGRCDLFWDDTAALNRPNEKIRNQSNIESINKGLYKNP